MTETHEFTAWEMLLIATAVREYADNHQTISYVNAQMEQVYDILANLDVLIATTHS